MKNAKIKHEPYGLYERYIKRILDVALSLVALVVLSPVLIIVALLVRINLGSPVFFRQERPGLDEKSFYLIKFRTMLHPQTRDGKRISDQERTELLVKGIEIMSDEERLTKFGKILRSTSLDELPELFNILKGDMSIVGPRPLSTAYLPYYNEFEKQRHAVRPGLTGLAQVNGRNSATWEERFKYDVEYANKITFSGDLKIICKTIAVVFKRDGIGQGSEIPVSFNEVRKNELSGKRG